MRYYYMSFDLWGTLIKGNPNTSKLRAEFFYKKYNRRSFSLDEVLRIIKQIDHEGNLKSESSGLTVMPEHYIVDILIALGYEFKDIYKKLVDDIENEIVLIFKRNPPTWYDISTPDILRGLRSQGKSFFYVSNTGFIRGKHMRDVLDTLKLPVSNKWTDFYFSDEKGISKPLKGICRLAAYAENILHVGDSIIADKGFAEAQQKDYVIINNPVALQDATINSIPSIKELPKYVKDRENIRT